MVVIDGIIYHANLEALLPHFREGEVAEVTVKAEVTEDETVVGM